MNPPTDREKLILTLYTGSGSQTFIKFARSKAVRVMVYRYELSKENQNYTIESLKGDSTLGLHLGARIHLGKIGIEGRIERGISENEAQLLSQNNINVGVIDNRTTVLSLGISYAF